MSKVKVSTVRYANSYPMNWGLIKGAASSLIDIEFDHPSGVAAKLSTGRADIGLVPVATIPTLKNPVIVGNWCIGTMGRVRTVMLMSNSPIDEIDTIWLDHRSVTSVNLARVLAREYWQKEFRWESPGEAFDYADINNKEGIVIIGDQCFSMENKFSYSYDLGEAWHSLTGLPFVFACWVAVNSPDRKFISIFDESIAIGIENRERAIAEMNTLETVTNEELATYLNENIDYRFDSEKRDAMKLFLEKIKTNNKR